MPRRRVNYAEDSGDSDYEDSPVPFAPSSPRSGPPVPSARMPRDWRKTTMPPARPPKKDPTFDPSKYEFEFAPYDARSSPLGYEGLLDMFPRPTEEEEESGLTHVKRVSNMFFVFRTHFTKTYKNVLDPRTGRPRHPIPEKDISRMAAWVWNFQMRPAERRPYFDTYLQLKYEHEQDHPDYKYQPTRPEEAERIKAEKARLRLEELQRQKEEAAVRREKDEEERKTAKISKKKWAALKREQRKQNEENGVPQLRLNTGVASDYATASPYSFSSTPLKHATHLGFGNPAVNGQGLKEPSPLPGALWNAYSSNQTPSRQGTPGGRQPIEVPRLIGTPLRGSPAPNNGGIMGLGLQFPPPVQIPSFASGQEQSPFDIGPSFSGPDWRQLAPLPGRANPDVFDDPSSGVFAPATPFDPLPPQYHPPLPPPPYTPPQSAPTKRLRLDSPAIPRPEFYSAKAPATQGWQHLTPVTPSPVSGSLAKQRMIWGVSPASDKVDRRANFGRRASPAPEDQLDYARNIISPRQARHPSPLPSQVTDPNTDPSLLPSHHTSQPRKGNGQKRRASSTCQPGRSRTPSYSSQPQVAANPKQPELPLSLAQQRLEEVFAAQARALRVQIPGEFSYLTKPDLGQGMFEGVSGDMAQWLGGSSLDYLPHPPPSSHSHAHTAHPTSTLAPLPQSPLSPRSPSPSPRSAYDLVSTFAQGFVHGPEYEARVGDIGAYMAGDIGAAGLGAEVRPVRSLSLSSQEGREDQGQGEAEEGEMSRFFDFNEGSEGPEERGRVLGGTVVRSPEEIGV